MRIIKFRGIPKQGEHKGEWVYGYFWKNRSGSACFIKDFETGNDYEVIPESVGQFTGLLDKNGVEIYEGDILQYISPINNENKEFCEVYWNEKYSSFEVRGQIDSCYNKNLGVFINRLSNNPKWEVIGNIYENNSPFNKK